MIVKLLSFKPNKDGSVTLYLDRGTDMGVDLHALIDMTGKEINIGSVVNDVAFTTHNDVVASRIDHIVTMVEELYELGKQEATQDERKEKDE